MQRKYTMYALFCASAGALLFALSMPRWRTDIRSGTGAGGFVHLTTNQVIHPWGKQTRVPGRPVDMAIDSSRRWIALLNISEVDLVDAVSDQILHKIKTRSTSYAGIAFRPDGREVWASETLRNADGKSGGADSIVVTALDQSGNPGGQQRITLPGHAVPAGIGFSHDGAYAYVALNRKNSLAVIDTRQLKLVREIEVGMAPFGVVVADNAHRVFVTNRGGRQPRPNDVSTSSGGSSLVTDPVSGSTTTGTVSVINLVDLSVREIPVGLAPAAIALSPDAKTVAVANAHGDSVTFIDTDSLALSTAKVPAYPETTIGSQPIGVSFSLDGSRLLVACAGNNSIAVLTRHGKLWQILGALPSAWFPTAVVVDSNSRIHTASIKGLGDTLRDDGAHVSTNWEGVLQTMPNPAPAEVVAGTREVRALNEARFDSAGGVANLASLGIQHVVLIVKENRTYDQILGDLKQGNGDPRFLHYGREVTPNIHALAEQYVLLDNFYATGAISFDGHQWLMMAFVSDYTERSFAAYPRGYAWNMGDSLTIAPTGFFWQGAPKPLSIRIYGEFCADPNTALNHRDSVDMNEHRLGQNWKNNMELYHAGAIPRLRYCTAGVPALAPVVDSFYPVSLDITDQFKADEFVRELDQFEKQGRMPNLVVIRLNNDHTQGTRPNAGTPRAMVADNDLALGRIVTRLSHSSFWPNMLVLATEDDAQDGLDHVDGHRTIGLAIGPHVRRGAVISDNYNHLSMIRTIQEIFAVPSRTRFAAAARAMTSIFMDHADLTPYEYIPANIPLIETNPPLEALQGRRRWAAEQSGAMDFSDIDRAPSGLLNRILCWDRRGYNTSYPAAGTHLLQSKSPLIQGLT